MKTVGKSILALPLIAALTGCTSLLDNPDPFAAPDPYVSGMRWFSRGEYKWAKKYWQPMAEDGDCDAAFRMGTLYFLGAGVPRDYEAARQWWRRAGNQGQSFAQALLGTMYAHDSMSVITMHTETWFDCTGGCGYPRNMVEAYKWMSLSEKCSPYPDTRKAAGVTAKRYRQSLTPGQIEEVDHFVKNWKAPSDACQPRELYGGASNGLDPTGVISVAADARACCPNRTHAVGGKSGAEDARTPNASRGPWTIDGREAFGVRWL